VLFTTTNEQIYLATSSKVLANHERQAVKYDINATANTSTTTSASIELWKLALTVASSTASNSLIAPLLNTN
jgi:hypothetical protein